MFRVTFNHTHREQKREKRGIVAGWRRKWDKHEEMGDRKAAERRGGMKKKQKKPHAEVRKMENLSSLGSQQSAELNLTRKMTPYPPSHKSD